MHCIAKQMCSVLAAVIIHIGDAFYPQTEGSHRMKAKRYHVAAPKRAYDSTTFFRRYIITNNDELFSTSEYACRVATGRHIHVL